MAPAAKEVAVIGLGIMGGAIALSAMEELTKRPRCMRNTV
jgi:3-hydroxyacyl-CoA dehydrogenase